MATKLTRNRKEFPFSRPLVGGRSQAEVNDHWRKEAELIHNHLQQQLDDAFSIIADKLYELETRIEVLEP